MKRDPFIPVSKRVELIRDCQLKERSPPKKASSPTNMGGSTEIRKSNLVS